MDCSGKRRSFRTVALITVAVIISLVPSVAATLVLTNVLVVPAPPLVPGPQEVTATLYIIPSGATTFPPGHKIQMQTELGDARWNMQVMVDGIPAAQQSAAGTVAFFNGARISYPTYRDVSGVVTINGTVPAAAGPGIVLLQAKEIDNGGNVVPNNLLVISRPVAGLTASATVTLATTVRPPSPTRAPGFSASAVIGAMVLGSVTARERLRRKNPRNKM